MFYLARVWRRIFLSYLDVWHQEPVIDTWLAHLCLCNWDGWDWAWAGKYDRPGES